METELVVGEVFGAQCHEPRCGWREQWTTQEAAQAAGVWHVHDIHPLKWLQIVGERPPEDTKPEALGHYVLCCGLHNEHCEPPSELCCGDCTEAHHGVHADVPFQTVASHHDGSRCVLTLGRA